MSHADFVFITVNEVLGGVGNDQTDLKKFNIDGKPTGAGYLLIQAHDVEHSGHRILINGKDLPGSDLPANPVNSQWQTWMDQIPAGYLKQGENSLLIMKIGGEQFTVRGVSVNWREER
jgi:hypothetical protein